MEGSARYCAACGVPLMEGAAFCRKCGAPRVAIGQAPQSVQQSAPQAAVAVTQPVATAPAHTFTASSAFGTAATVAGMAGMATAVPWQTIVGDQRPDIGAILSTAALPAAQQFVRSSLRRPGIAMAVTTAIDTMIAIITGGMAGLLGALPRLLMGSATSVLSLVTGGRSGSLRTITGVVAIVTAVVQLGFAGQRLFALFTAGGTWLSLVPGAISMLSMLVMAVKTAVVALRRP